MGIFEIWLTKAGSVSTKSKQIFGNLLEQLPDAENLNCANLEKKIFYLCKKIAENWAKARRNKDFFLKTNSNWLIKTDDIFVNIQVSKLTQVNKPSTRTCGRPKKNFDECCRRSQQRKLSQISVIDNSLITMLRRPSSNVNYKKVDADEVLSLLVEAKLTKHQYILLRNFINSKINNMFPSYQKVLKSKKKCYPSEDYIKITESSAEIELQNLLDHTASRIWSSQQEVINSTSDNQDQNLVLFGKWGFDGSSGHSEYKQSFQDPTFQDGSLFVTSYVPLRLVFEDNPEKIVWKNPRTSSTRYCRPLRFQFKKETKEAALNEEKYFTEKINSLKPTVVSFNDKNYSIKHKLQLTMVDGKICSSLTESSSARCYICGSSPKEMNDIDLCLQKQVRPETFEFFLSPLHSYIRFFEYFLHLSYRLNLKKWQIRSKEERQLFSERKGQIQSEFRNKLGLIVDKPKCGGSGTSNDGNTARKFFKQLDESSEITGLSKSLLERCSVILRCISSGFKINIIKFKEFSLSTARLLVAEYPWYNLPPSVHKVLIHGPDVIESAILPIGELSEEAAEAKNKEYKLFRLNHTRKMSRTKCNMDLLNRLLLSSDPLVTELRKLPPKNKNSFPKAVLDLLDE